MIPIGDFGGRRAPYAPISALERFFERIRDRAVPEAIDQHFLRKINVANNNEYSLLSALKFLGVLDDRGRPTTAYRQLQTTDRFEETLAHLVRTSYRPVFLSGVHELDHEDLVNFFRVSSSPSQARNAARFFQAVCRLAAIGPDGTQEIEDPIDSPGEADVISGQSPDSGQAILPKEADFTGGMMPESKTSTSRADNRLRVKAQLLEKLPAPLPSWSAQDYKEICALFVQMLQSLEAD